MTKDELIEFLYNTAKEYLINTECPMDQNNTNECNMECINCWDDFIKNRYKTFKKEDDVV